MIKLTFPLINHETIDSLRELGEDSNSAFLLEMVDLFFKHAVPLSDEVRELLKGHNQLELASKIHALKSQIANFGAMELAQICQNIEKDARSNNYKPNHDDIRVFMAGFAGMVKELEEIKRAELSRAA